MSISANKVQEEEMSENELLKLKGERDKIIKKYGFFSAVAFFLMIASAIGSFLYVPSIIISVFMLIIMRSFWYSVKKTKQLYLLDESEGLKESYLTQILEKSMDQLLPYECWITTDIGKHKVSPMLYETLKENEEAIVSIGKHSQWLINVQTSTLDDIIP